MRDFRDYPCLKMYVSDQYPMLREFYTSRVANHNESVMTSQHPDSGFDLGIPESKTLTKRLANKIPLAINCSFSAPNGQHLPYYLYPRSSISRTPLRLSNSVGIIDSGYRGVITAVVDSHCDNQYDISSHERYFQICHPNLQPFVVEIAPNINDLGSTIRGSGGFGSTGR